MNPRDLHKKGSRLLARLFLIALFTFVLAACQAIQPAPASPASQFPVRLTISALDMDVPVTPMGWEIISSAGERTTRWVLPAQSAGWHLGSALPGEPGVALISGSQNVGDAVFAPLALGEVTPGQEIVVTLSNGEEASFVVTEVSQPVPLHGASDSESAAVDAYLAPGSGARLVLITGWPDFTTTHRVFVVAEAPGE